ncbi:MAG: DMT family protein [Planctomycetota bacterium]
MPPFVWTVLLLICSNGFMTYAWYYHLNKKEQWPLVAAIGISWLIALPEYILQVPGNRIGSATMSLAQLKIIQEGISLAVFSIYAITVAKQTPRWQDFVAMLLIFAAVAISFSGRPTQAMHPADANVFNGKQP